MKENYSEYSKKRLVELLCARDREKESEKAENELRSAEERFRAISENSLNAICILNLSGKIIWANAACEQLSGCTLEQIYGVESFAVFIAPESMDFVLPNFGEFVLGNDYIHSYQFYIVRVDGEKRLCQKYMTHYIDQNGDRNLIISMIDITEQNKAQEELMLRESELNNAQEIAKMGSWNFDLQTLNYTWSRTNYIMLGMVPFEMDVTVELFMQMVHPDDRERLDTFIKEVIQTKEQGTIDIRVPLRNEEIIWLQNVIVPTIVNNEVVALKGVNLNITELKVNEERVKELNATLEEKIRIRTQQLLETNRELIQRTEELENFFNLSLDLLCIGDLEGNLLKVSNSWEVLLGYPKGEIEGSNFFRYVHPDEIERTVAALKETKENPNFPHFFTNRHVKKNGEAAILEWQTFPVGDLVYAAGRDVTERIEKERIQHENDERYRVTVNAVDDVIHVIDKEFKLLLYNQTFVDEMKKVGLDGDFSGKNLFELCPFLDTKLAQEYQTVFETGQPLFIEEFTQFDHKPRWSDTRKIPIKDESGNTYRILTLIHDITERKKMEAEIKISRERLSNFIEATNVGTWEWEVQTGKIISNDQWAEMLGYSLQEISPTTVETWSSLVHPDDLIKAQDQLNQIFDKKPVDYDVDVRMKHKNGYWSWVQTKGKVVEWTEDGKPLKMSGTHTDISARKKAEEEMIRAKNEAEKANQAKSEFLSRMSHELRTPMNSILGFAQLLELADLNAKQKKGVNHIIKSGKHLLTLINEVLDISRIEAGGLPLAIEPVQISRVVCDVMDLTKPMADERKITVEFDQEQNGSRFVYADVQRLKQVLLNLLNNAVKYNKYSGEIHIAITPSMNDSESQGWHRISISDTGMGIKENDLDKLFNPFERVGREKSMIEGTGLGLAVVKKFVEAMNGSVGVESTPGVGSTFWIELPQATNQNELLVQADKTDAPITKSCGKGVVLYIEDNLSNVELVEQILAVQRPEIRLVTTQFGMQTLPFALEYQPNLILLDLNLPDIHGIEALQQILHDERVNSIPIVVVSADAMPNQISRLLHAGAVAYLQKPIDVIQFVEVVDTFVSKQHKT